MNLPAHRKLRASPSKRPFATPARDETDAHNNLGVLYSSGDIHRRDLPAALLCFRKAAELGHAVAQNNLGMMLAGGKGTPKDSEQAAAWFLRAASQGDASAQFHLATRCHRANARPLTAKASEGRIQALMWFQLSARQGYHKADQWCARLRLNMSPAEVREARRRADVFVPRKESGS